MDYRKHQDVSLSEVGIGCYALSGVYGKVDPISFQSLIQRAFELGINYFDTAEAYGDGERILGEAVRPFRSQILLATKAGVKEGARPNLSREYISAACEASLAALGTDYIDVYQVHFHDPATPVEESVRALEDLVSDGKVRHWGIGHLSLDIANAYFKTGKVFSVLMELSAAERNSLKSLLPLCRDGKAAAIAFSVTGRGLLTARFQEGHRFNTTDIRHMDPLFQRERFRSGLRIAAKLGEIGSLYGKTAAQVGIAWVLAQPGIVCALTGPSSIDHLEENTAASGWVIDDSSLNTLDDYLDGEQARIEREQRLTLANILKGPLPHEAQAAFVDLVYAIETLLALELASEGQVVPLFYDLYSLRESLHEPGISQKLEGFKVKLKELYRTSQVHPVSMERL